MLISAGMFSAFAAFLDDRDEVIVMQPFFDQYISISL